MASTVKEVFNQDFKILHPIIIIKDLSSIGKEHECDFQVKVFAHLADTTDIYKNDFTAPLISLNNSQPNAKLFLEKQGACDFTQIAQLNDDTYGYEFGTVDDPDIQFNGNRPDWIGYHIDWHNVLTIDGAGCYRIRLEFDDFITGATSIEFSYTYDLKPYSDDLADGTSRYTYGIFGGVRGSQFKDDEIIDYGTVKWTRQIRVEGVFGYSDGQSYTSEYLREQSGAQKWLQDSSIETYQADLKGLPSSLHQEFKKVVLHADSIIVDDYNEFNINEYVNKRILRDSDYEPDYDRFVSYSSVILQFTQYHQNIRNKRC